MIEPHAIRMKAAAEYLGVGVKTVRYWVDEGQLSVITGPARHSPWRFMVRDLEEFLQKTKHTVRSASQR